MNTARDHRYKGFLPGWPIEPGLWVALFLACWILAGASAPVLAWETGAGKIQEVLRHPIPEYRRVFFTKIGETDSQQDWRTRPPAEIVAAGHLQASMTVDVAAYLAERIPEPIRRIACQSGVRVILAGGLWEQTAQAMKAWGWRPLFGLVRTRDVNSKAYLFGRNRDGQWALIVTNIFGRDRLRHLFLEYAFLRAGLADLEWREPSDFDGLDRRLASESLKGVTAGPSDVVVLGYQSSFNIVAWYWREFARTGRPWDPTTFLDWKASHPRPRSFPKPVVAGNAFFPWWEYRLPGQGGKPTRFLSFRNLYGDAAGTLLAELFRRGFRRFIAFGNAGGLGSRTLSGHIYAPVWVSSGSGQIDLPNQAAGFYPPRSVIGVSSVLEESFSWLEAHRGRFDLVEVEHASLAQALRGTTGVFFFSGLLVSDRPGEHDLTRFDESSPNILAAKDRFLFEAIREALRP